MAVFTETIALEDEVSPAAKSAGDSLSGLDKKLTDVNKSLVNTEGLASKASEPLTSAGKTMNFGERMAALRKGKTIETPTATAATGLGGDRADESIFSVPKQMPNPLTGKSPTPSLAAPNVGDFTEKPGQAKFDAASKLTGGKLAFDKSSYKDAQAAAAGLEAKLKSLASAQIQALASGDMTAYTDLTKQIHGAEAALAKLPKPLEEGGKAHEGMWSKAAHAAEMGKETIGEAIRGIGASFQALKAGNAEGAVEGITEALSGMAKMLDLVVPGLGEAVSYAIKIAGGLAGVTAGLVQEGAKLAIEATQARTQMEATFGALAEGSMTGKQAVDMLGEMSNKLGVAKSDLAPFAKQAMQMGITTKEALEKVTTAAISAQAAVGDPSGADAFMAMTKKLQNAAEHQGVVMKIPAKGLGSLGEMGLGTAKDYEDMAKRMGMSTTDLTAKLKAGLTGEDAKKFSEVLQDAMIKKGKGALDQLGLTTENLSKMFHQNIEEMFEIPAAKTFMKQVKDLLSLFSESTVAGKVMKASVGLFFQHVFEIATKLVPFVKFFFVMLLVYGLQAYQAIAPFIDKFEAWLKSAKGTSALSTLWEVLKGIGKAFLVVGGVITIIVGFMGAMVVAGMLLFTAIANIGIAIVSYFMPAFLWILNGMQTVTSAIYNFVADALGALWGWVSSAAETAANFIQGIVDGITGGAGKVVDSVKNLASGAIDAVKGIFQSHSPSQVMIGIGGFVADGLAQGMDDGGKDVHGAASAMAQQAVAGVSSTAPPSLQAGSAGGSPIPAQGPLGGSSGGGTGGGITVEAGAIVINGADKSVQEITEEMVAGIMERLGMAAGVA